ncbi:hypothetical protein CRG98_010194 [Punica granatum]|uniref:Uncharacterized protein n=1 Tax=Punica granatum TaxID=22663 RepID=A0A2I0KNI9_PUNGR|nr:hypothetical protein CRG98_010194 [Punica granatum]
MPKRVESLKGTSSTAKLREINESRARPSSARRLPETPPAQDPQYRGFPRFFAKSVEILTPVRSRSTTVKHRRRPELSPAPSRAVVAVSKGQNRRPQSRRRRSRRSRRPPANGPRPISLSSQAQPKSIWPNAPNPAQRSSGRFLLRAG